MENNHLPQEDLLQAWLEMSMFIRGNRFLSDLSFNEIIICGLLFRQQEAEATPITATELCEHTNLLKSQVNHILTGMETRGLIQRIRSTQDKRVVHIHLLEAGRTSYLQEHEKVMQITQAVFDALGSPKAQELTALMKQVTAVVNTYQKGAH